MALAKEKKKKSKIKRLLLVLVVLVLVVTAYANRRNLSAGSIKDWFSEQSMGRQTGDGFPVTLSGNTVLSIDELNGDPMLLTDTAFLVYNSNGREIVNRQHGYSSAGMAGARQYALIYDTDGTGYKLETKARTLFQKELSQKIITGDVSSGGVHALASRSKGYLGEVTVFDRKGEQLYKWYSADANIFAVALNEKGDRLAVVTVNTDKGEVKSSLLVFDFSKKEPITQFTYPGTLILDAAYINKSTIGLVGDNKYITVAGPNKGNDTVYEYSGRYLTGYSLRPNTGTALLLSQYADKRSPSLIQINAKGTMAFQKDNTDQVRDVFLGEKFTFLLKDTRAISYTAAGEEKNSIETADDSLCIAEVNGKLFVLGLSELRVGK